MQYSIINYRHHAVHYIPMTHVFYNWTFSPFSVFIWTFYMVNMHLYLLFRVLLLQVHLFIHFIHSFTKDVEATYIPALPWLIGRERKQIL